MNDDNPEFSTIVREHKILKENLAKQDQELQEIKKKNKELTARLVLLANAVVDEAFLENMDSGTLTGLSAMLTEFKQLMDIQPRLDGLERLVTNLEEAVTRGNQAVPKPKQKPPMSPDPSYGGDKLKMSTTPMAHFWGQALTAGGPNARRLRNSWTENQANQHPKFARTRITHKGGEATVYFDPQNYSEHGSSVFRCRKCGEPVGETVPAAKYGEAE